MTSDQIREERAEEIKVRTTLAVVPRNALGRADALSAVVPRGELIARVRAATC
jgi:hypothetical protein